MFACACLYPCGPRNDAILKFGTHDVRLYEPLHSTEKLHLVFSLELLHPSYSIVVNRDGHTL